MIQNIKIAEIRTDGGTQMRAEIDMLVVADYAEAYREGADMPPLVVFWDGNVSWLADGFHRYHGAQKAGFDSIPCDVRPGSRRDAVLFACGANAAHGLRRTNADKRLAVETILLDEEWVLESDNWTARKCGVSNSTVSLIRQEMVATLRIAKSDHRKGADGRTINTANIGKSTHPNVSPKPALDVSVPANGDLPGQSYLFNEDEEAAEEAVEEATEEMTEETFPDDEPSANGKLPPPRLHVKLVAALDDFDNFTRALTAQLQHAGYGGHRAIIARIPPDEIRRVQGRVRMLRDRLSEFLSCFEESAHV